MRSTFHIDYACDPQNIVPAQSQVTAILTQLQQPGYTRFSHGAPRLTPMALDYETVGKFYESLGVSLQAFVARVGEDTAFSGGAALQMSGAEINAAWARPMLAAVISQKAWSQCGPRTMITMRSRMALGRRPFSGRVSRFLARAMRSRASRIRSETASLC